MGAPTHDEIREAVTAAGRVRFGLSGTPQDDIEEAIGSWVLNVSGYGGASALYERWPCSEEECPARPEWDRKLDDLYSDVTRKVKRQLYRRAESALSRAFADFAAAYPDATRKKVEEAV